ncbi:MAG: hypothetical protein WA931_14100 [Rhodococcus sp. (in: high G+C Gram-positive bacteria)]
MTNDDSTGTDERSTDDTDNSGEDTVGPELTQEDLDRAGEKMDGLDARYTTGSRETVTVPGTGGTVSGTAFADMDFDTEKSEDETSDSDTSEDDTSEGEK